MLICGSGRMTHLHRRLRASREGREAAGCIRRAPTADHLRQDVRQATVRSQCRVNTTHSSHFRQEGRKPERGRRERGGGDGGETARRGEGEGGGEKKEKRPGAGSRQGGAVGVVTWSCVTRPYQLLECGFLLLLLFLLGTRCQHTSAHTKARMPVC